MKSNSSTLKEKIEKIKSSNDRFEKLQYEYISFVNTSNDTNALISAQFKEIKVAIDQLKESLIGCTTVMEEHTDSISTIEKSMEEVKSSFDCL